MVDKNIFLTIISKKKTDIPAESVPVSCYFQIDLLSHFTFW